MDRDFGESNRVLAPEGPFARLSRGHTSREVTEGTADFPIPLHPLGSHLSQKRLSLGSPRLPGNNSRGKHSDGQRFPRFTHLLVAAGESAYLQPGFGRLHDTR